MDALLSVPYLKIKLAVVIPDDSGCQAGRTGSLARCVDSDRGNLGRKLEELGLGSGWVTNEQHVHITSPIGPIGHFLRKHLVVILLLNSFKGRSHSIVPLPFAEHQAVRTHRQGTRLQEMMTASRSC